MLRMFGMQFFITIDLWIEIDKTIKIEIQAKSGVTSRDKASTS